MRLNDRTHTEVRRERSSCVAGFEAGGRGHDNAGSFQKPEKAGERTLPSSLKKEPELWTILDV